MKRAGIRFVFSLFLITAALLSTPASSSAAYTGRQLADSAMASLKGASTAFSTTRNVPSLYYTWYEANLKYNPGPDKSMDYPLTVDILGSNFSSPTKIVYMLPGGGMNFRASFLTPLDDCLAQYFRKSGYLVVGITPREDNVPSSVSDYYFMKDWGMEEHLQDIQTIIGIIQKYSLCSGKPYKVLGHSFGAAFALDYASKCPPDLAPVKVIALDIYSFDTDNPDDPYVQAAEDSYGAFDDAITNGYYIDSSYTSLKSLMLISTLLPYVISTESYDETYYNEPSFKHRYFTYEGFLYYSLINSANLGSVRAGDWPLAKGYVAGTYTIRSTCNPYLDTYSLAYSSMSTLKDASMKIGSGLVPLAVYRDFFAANMYNGTYDINWPAITCTVEWVNTQFGYNGFKAGADKVKGPVWKYTVDGYGHLDILSNNARNTRGVNGQKAVWSWLTYPDYPKYN